MRPFLAILILSLTTACAVQTPSPTPTVPANTPSVAAPTATSPATPEPSPTPVPLPATQWAGGLTHTDNATESILVNLTGPDSALTSQPLIATLPISEVKWDGLHLSFTTTGKRILKFIGTFDGHQVTGMAEEDGQSEPFTLLPLIEVPQTDLPTWAGTYRFENGEALTVHISPAYDGSKLHFFWSGLTITHFGNGDIRGLYPIAPDTFLVGSGRVLGYPFVAQMTFQRDSSGIVTGVDWQTRNLASGQLSQSQLAQQIALTTETVHFTSSDGVTLTGLLTLPDSLGPHPAIVVLHGSEPGTRADFGRQQLSTFFASQGLAVLTYDKRGVGDSEGVYVERASESNLTTLAQDSLAGVAFLQSRSEVDAKRVGLIGSSQAGWIIPIAAQQSKDVAFFIILSGPVVSVGEEVVYSSYTNNGDTETHYAPEIVATAMAKASASGFNPLPIIAELKQPGLWVWGGHDLSQPVPQGEVNLKKLIADGRSNFSYVILPNGDHNLQVSPHGLFDEIPYAPGYSTDFFTTISAWIKALP
jgi:uncharacterized protein